MTEQPPSTPVPLGGRIDPIDIQLEMQRSYLDYAMSVIVARALPDVRDGLKPVHRRVLYAMYDGGFRPDRSYSKCARVVGEVMGQYHPHGDGAIYDTLVRLAQTWSLRYPLVDGQGNFGSPGNDPAAAMRYCVVGSTRIRQTDGSTPRIDDLVPEAQPNSTHDVELKVLDRHGQPVTASKVFHSGSHPTLTVRVKGGYELTGTHNHPVLTLRSVLGVPTLLWSLLSEIVPGDVVVLSRPGHLDFGASDERSLAEARLAGSSGAKKVPEFVWSGGSAIKSTFLQSLFTGDGSVSLLPRNTIQISYSTRSPQLAREVQQLLLEFGVVSKQVIYAHGEIKIVITNRRDAHRFDTEIGFMGDKGAKLTHLLLSIPQQSRALSADHVPYLADFIRSSAANSDQDHYAPVVAVVDAGEQPVWSIRVESDDHSFVTDGFISHNTECRMAPLAMEMVRDIDKDTVDFFPNYDGKTQEPNPLPARFPNLLVNGSSGIAVGMATNIPPHNLREVAEGVQWLLANPEASEDELLAQLLLTIKGPDFPTSGLIMGTHGIEDAYRTGRGSITMRAIVEVEEIQNRTCLVITELPYQVNPDNLKVKIAELHDAGKLQGIANILDDTSGKTGMRIVIQLKRDAIAKVVLNNLYKHTQLQDNFGANMLALVDGVPRTLSIDKFVRHWVDHQIDVIVRRTRYLLAEAERQAHIYRGYVKALDALDEVIALIRASATVDDARGGLIDLLDIDEVQADAILAMQLRRLAALERQKIIEELARLHEVIADLESILASPARQRQIISDELAEIVNKYGDERRTKILPFDADMNVEDLIPEEDVVVSITRAGYAKRTRTDAYRAQRRGGKGVKGAQLRSDDVVEHFFITSTHNWILFFTNLGRVYRAKAYELPEQGRDARGQHVANLLAFQPDEEIAQVMYLRTYEDAPFLVLATRDGLVKKTRLTEYDSNRAGGVIAINLREGDELVAARLVDERDDLLLVSRKGMSVRFTADDSALRPMGRATSGVTGMKFRRDDQLLSMDVVGDGDESYVFVVTENGYAKRTPIDQYRVQGRGGLGIKVAKITDERGDLVAGMIVGEDDEVLVVMQGGKVVRSPVAGVPAKGRDTMGVVFAKPDAGDRIIGVARNAESTLEDEPIPPVGVEGADAVPSDVDHSSDTTSDDE